MKMPNDLKTRWLEALRSGAYKQGRGLLCDFAGRYCCLGVLQAVADGEVEMNRGHGVALAMPTEEWYEKHGICPERGWESIQRGGKLVEPLTLANKNDQGHSFTEIADFIEKNVEGYDNEG